MDTESSESDFKIAIGIDIGNTTTRDCVWIDDKPHFFSRDQIHKTIPSVAFINNMECSVGNSAFDKITSKPSSFVFNIKRLLGRGYDDPEIQRTIEDINNQYPYKIGRYDNATNRFIHEERKNVYGDIRIEITNDDESKCYFDPVDIYAYFFEKCKQAAEEFIGKKVDSAVITIPDSYNNNQRVEMIYAARIASFKNVKLINESTSTVVFHGFELMERKHKDVKRTTIFDFGSSALNIYVIDCDDQKIKLPIFNILCREGDTHLGGMDFDNALFKHCINTVEQRIGTVLLSDKNKLELINACEKAKISLSEVTKTSINIKNFVGDKDFSIEITRQEFEDLCKPLFRRCIERVKGCLLSVLLTIEYDENGNILMENPPTDDFIKSQMSATGIVKMVGGSSKIPKLKEMLRDELGMENIEYIEDMEYHAVSGAGYLGALASGDPDIEHYHKTYVPDYTYYKISVEIEGNNAPLEIARNAKMPQKLTQTISTTYDNQSEIKIQVYEGIKDGRFNQEKNKAIKQEDDQEWTNKLNEEIFRIDARNLLKHRVLECFEMFNKTLDLERYDEESVKILFGDLKWIEYQLILNAQISTEEYKNYNRDSRNIIYELQAIWKQGFNDIVRSRKNIQKPK